MTDINQEAQNVYACNESAFWIAGDKVQTGQVVSVIRPRNSSQEMKYRMLPEGVGHSEMEHLDLPLMPQSQLFETYKEAVMADVSEKVKASEVVHVADRLEILMGEEPDFDMAYSVCLEIMELNPAVDIAFYPERGWGYQALI
ncbi:hypothetical protein [Neptuniibacter sp. QD37_11]|uniref:hypothetical protein n=1 Tax=Neptuniibacter sp. QD37_11 TaxID=3398209 RepID=UPI0039F5B824